METISPDIRRLISYLFVSESEQAEIAQRLIDIFSLRHEGSSRLICAVLRVSCGQFDRAYYSKTGRLDEFESAIALLDTDWRDLLMAAGFGEDIKAHEEWMSATLKEPQ